MTQTGNSATGFSAATTYQSSFDNGVTPSACATGGCQNGAPTGPYSVVNPFPNGLTAAPRSSLRDLSQLGQGSKGHNARFQVPRPFHDNTRVPQPIYMETG